MAAPSPRKPRRAKGRHRKPSTYEPAKCAQWLGMGAVGIGLAAAIGSSQGTAWAAPDDSSNPADASGARSAGPARTSARENGRPAPRPAADRNTKRQTASRVPAQIHDTATTARRIQTSTAPTNLPAADPAVKIAAASASASDTPALGSPEHFVATLQTILNQLVGWPEPPTTKFVTPANYQLDQALDAHDLTIDRLVANPTPATRWIPDLLGVVGLFFKPALPGYTFATTLNAWGSLLNRVVPPYRMKVDGITEAQVAGAAVGALVNVLDKMLAGDLDTQDLYNAAVAGGTAGFLAPGSVLNMTFSSGAAPSFFSVLAYITLVTVYDRFKWVALDHLPVVTGMTQTGQLLFAVAGKVTASDADGDPLTYSVTQPENGVVTVGLDGSWLYTRTSGLSQSGTDTFTMTIDDSLGQVGDLGLSHPYAPYGHSVTTTVTVNYSGLANNSPISAVSVGLPDAMGVVRGTVSGFDIDGDTLSFGLVNPGTAGATNSSIYTGEGGIVSLNTTTGEFVYVPKVSTDFLPGLDTDSFQVQVSDGRGGTSTATVIAFSNLSPGTSTTSTSAYVENGKVNVPTSDVGLLTYSLGTGPSKGTVVVNSDGTYTYTRNTSLPSSVSTSDSFTIIGTDSAGKKVTLPTVSVSPPLVTVTPTTTASGGTFVPRGMIGGVAITPGSQTTTGTFSATDANGNPVTIAAGIYSSALGGTVTVVSGGGFLYSYTTYSDAFHRAAADNAPATDRVDTVQIGVTDTFGVTTQVSFSVQLRTENATPSSSSSVGGADGLGVVRGSVSGSDSDGDSFTYSLTGAYTAQGGIVSLNADGSFTYIPNKSASQSDSFSVLVSDGHGGTTTATVNVPLSTPSPVTNVNTSTAGVVTGSLNIPGADSGLMTYSVGTGPAKGTVTVNADGTFAYSRTAGLGHSTTPSDSFTIVGTEVASGRTVTIATVNVTPVVANSAPVGGPLTVATSALNDTDIGINRQQATTGTLGASDADGDPLTFAAGTYDTTNGGSITVNADGSFTYLSAKKLKGAGDRYWHNAAVPGAPGDTFAVTVSDAFGGSTTLVYSVPIQTLNKNPNSTVAVSVSGADGLGIVRGTITGSDDDNNNINYTLYGIQDNLSYSLAGAGNPSGATVTSATTANGAIVQLNANTFTYIPTKGVTSDSFNVLVSDGHGGTAVATVSVGSLTTPSPVTNIDTSTTNVVSGRLNIPAADSGLGLTYSVGTGPTKGTVTVNADGSFTYTRTVAGHSASPGDTFTVKATDAFGRQVTIATVNVTPTVANNAPVGGAVTVGSSSLASGLLRTQTTTGTIGASDADGDPIAFTAGTFSTTNGGSVTVAANGSFTYTMNKLLTSSYYHDAAKIGATGNTVVDTFTVTVSDAFGGGTTFTAAVPIYAVNSAPTLSGGIEWFTSYWTGVSASDGDGDSRSVAITAQPQHGSASYDQTTQILSTTGARAGDTIQLTVTDGYYVVVSGAVTGTPASYTRTYTL